MIRAVWDQGFKRSYKKRVRNNSRLKKSQETNTPNSGIVATFHMPPSKGIYPPASPERELWRTGMISLFFLYPDHPVYPVKKIIGV